MKTVTTAEQNMWKSKHEAGGETNSNILRMESTELLMCKLTLPQAVIVAFKLFSDKTK